MVITENFVLSFVGITNGMGTSCRYLLGTFQTWNEASKIVTLFWEKKMFDYHQIGDSISMNKGFDMDSDTQLNPELFWYNIQHLMSRQIIDVAEWIKVKFKNNFCFYTRRMNNLIQLKNYTLRIVNCLRTRTK